MLTGRAAAQEVPINKLSNARTAKGCMVFSMNTVPKTRKSAGSTGLLHDFYTIISLSSLGHRGISRVRVV